jgi:dihydrofolate reductase
MGKVIFVISMSLDGFITAANRSPEEPMGKGGEKLHEWVMDQEDTRNREILTQGIGGIGAVIAGRRTYDDSIPWWGTDGPTGSARVPLFVVSHAIPEKIPADGVYTFVNGIEKALKRAKAAAGDKDVSVMGGAEIGQQFIRAGLVDEIQIHLVPVLFGDGLRLFDHLGSEHIDLETVEVTETAAAIHLRFRVVK